jgi:hypothetical protein
MSTHVNRDKRTESIRTVSTANLNSEVKPEIGKIVEAKQMET